MLRITILAILTCASSLNGQTRDAGGGPARAGGEFQPTVGQGTNFVSAREVRWTGSYGLEGRAYVFLAKDSGQAVAAPSTNQVCFFKGKLIAVEPSIQSFSLLTSRSVPLRELTGEAAVGLLENVPRKSTRRKEVDLRVLLKPEAERHLAQPLLLRSAQIRSEDGRLVVDFESCAQLKGRVVLDDRLNVISATLLDTPNP
jgi:hypothetical protein